MAPLVEMLPTNFFPDAPPSPDPEPDPDPELEPEDAPDPDPDPELDELPLDEEPDPELVPAPDPEVEPEELPVDPELEDDAVDREAPSELELDPVPPPASLDPWFESAEEPHAMRMDARLAGRRRREWEA